jgi:hypothetical protein
MPQLDGKYNLRRVDHELRAETGPLQFGEDWPGVFIRGDEALGLADRINMCLTSGLMPPASLPLFREVVDLLISCLKAD